MLPFGNFSIRLFSFLDLFVLLYKWCALSATTASRAHDCYSMSLVWGQIDDSTFFKQ